MFFEPNKNKEICYGTGGLKLGRLYAYSPSSNVKNHENFFATTDELRKISNLEVLPVTGKIPCYSIRLKNSIIKDKNKVQKIITAIQQNLEGSIASEIIDTLRNLTGYQLDTQTESPSNYDPSETQSKYQLYIDNLQKTMQEDKELLTYLTEHANVAPKALIENRQTARLPNKDALQSAIIDQENRIATLRKMEKNESITKNEYQILLCIEPIAADAAIASYANVIPEQRHRLNR